MKILRGHFRMGRCYRQIPHRIILARQVALDFAPGTRSACFCGAVRRHARIFYGAQQLYRFESPLARCVERSMHSRACPGTADVFIVGKEHRSSGGRQRRLDSDTPCLISAGAAARAAVRLPATTSSCVRNHCVVAHVLCQIDPQKAVLHHTIFKQHKGFFDGCTFVHI